MARSLSAPFHALPALCWSSPMGRRVQRVTRARLAPLDLPVLAAGLSPLKAYALQWFPLAISPFGLMPCSLRLIAFGSHPRAKSS